MPKPLRSISAVGVDTDTQSLLANNASPQDESVDARLPSSTGTAPQLLRAEIAATARDISHKHHMVPEGMPVLYQTCPSPGNTETLLSSSTQSVMHAKTNRRPRRIANHYPENDG